VTIRIKSKEDVYLQNLQSDKTADFNYPIVLLR